MHFPDFSKTGGGPSICRQSPTEPDEVITARLVRRQNEPQSRNRLANPCQRRDEHLFVRRPRRARNQTRPSFAAEAGPEAEAPESEEAAEEPVGTAEEETPVAEAEQVTEEPEEPAPAEEPEAAEKEGSGNPEEEPEEPASEETPEPEESEE